MKSKKKIIIVMPAFNAEKTLEKTYKDIPKGLASEVILVDDGSNDKTIDIAKKLKLTLFVHKKNLGYGANQKTCYKEALKKKADIVIMLHPDYQYDASLLDKLIEPIIEDRYHVMFGNRIRTRKEALDGGMPVTKYVLNRVVSIIENIILGTNLSEHLSGLRAYDKKVLKRVPYELFSNDFVFDQQFMISAISYGFKVSDIPVPVRYFSEASSIRFVRGSKYLIETFYVLFRYILHNKKIVQSSYFKK